PLPRALRDRLGGYQVLLGVDAPQAGPRVRHLLTVLGEVAQLAEQDADPVEGLGDRVGAPADPPLQVIGLAAQLPPAFGPAGMVLAVRALVARVLAHPAPQIVRIGMP